MSRLLSVRPYNRALCSDDYQYLDPYVQQLAAFERSLHGVVNYRNDHLHRRWEYASILQQLAELGLGSSPADGHAHQFRVPEAVKILDTGSGASYFPLFLKMQGYTIAVNDSMLYGDTTEWLRAQCFHLGVQIPLIVAPIEKLGLDDNQWDVTLCVSVIEHLPTTEFANGLKELWRVTKPGGYLMITSDYFKDEPHALTSPSLGIQLNRFYPHTTERMINDHIDVKWVGGVDLTYHEPGLVNGHSFVNLCLRKPC